VSAAPTMLALRVTVGDTWTPLAMEASSDETVAALKERALRAFHFEAGRADAYEVKHGGAAMRNETLSLRSSGIGDGAALVVLARRRRPVR